MSRGYLALIICDPFQPLKSPLLVLTAILIFIIESHETLQEVAA